MASLIERVASRRIARGLAIVEAALLFPLLLLMLFGMLEYGWIFLKSEQIQNVARQACRVGVTDSGTQAQVTTLIDTLMTSAGMPSGTSGFTATLSPPDPGVLDKGDMFTVTVTVPYANVELIGIPLIPVPTDLGGTTSMIKEGPP